MRQYTCFKIELWLDLNQEMCYTDDVVWCRQAKADTHEQHGWPHNTYAASKVGVILLSKIQQANIDKDPSRQDIVINAVG
jgi:hypothetical protein